MSLRFMRMILFFDLPSVTDADKRIYRQFVKHLAKEGFGMLQESVYTKLGTTQTVVDSTIARLRKVMPREGVVSVLVVTERQFASMEHLLGSPGSDIVDSVDKYVRL